MGQHGRDRTGMARTRGEDVRNAEQEDVGPEATTVAEGGFAPQAGGQVGIQRPTKGTGPLVGPMDKHVVDELRAGRGGKSGT